MRLKECESYNKIRDEYIKIKFDIFKNSAIPFEELAKSEFTRTRSDLFSSTEKLRVAFQKLKKEHQAIRIYLWVSIATNTLLFLWNTIQIINGK